MGKSSLPHASGRQGKGRPGAKKPSRLGAVGKRPALRDVPDIRDRIYEPTLRPLPAELVPPRDLAILDQGDEGACTGFALAAAIHRLLAINPATREDKRRVSAQMLYRMARRHDEWPGEKDEGSSLRGALRGFYNCGVCRDDLWDTVKDDVTLASARDARITTLGAYYRLRPVLADYHAAINETGVIYVSASVHDGWDDPADGRIKPGGLASGSHAFVLVGYNDEGFWVQNSWGKSWGTRGLALWEYGDWSRSVTDAWVLQLAVSAPTAFGLGFSRDVHEKTALDVSRTRRTKPNRQEIAGHFVHFNNGGFSADAPYWSSGPDVAATSNAIAGSDARHFVFYAHGGLNSPDEAATRTAAMVDGFMRNGAYPYSVFYDTGLARTLKDLVRHESEKLLGRTGGFGDFWDGLVEKALGSIGTSLWREMKRDARLPFEPGHDGEASLRAFLQAFSGRPDGMSVHLVGHSTGGVLIGHLLDALERIATAPITIDSICLMAPACSIDFYRKTYQPRLGADTTGKVRIKKMHLYNLDDEHERSDNVAGVYRKSLLYLVSNAFEEKPGLDLLGMQEGIERPGNTAITRDKGLSIFYSGNRNSIPKACSHGGFDNDPATINHILATILGATPARPFTREELDYGGA